MYNDQERAINEGHVTVLLFYLIQVHRLTRSVTSSWLKFWRICSLLPVSLWIGVNLISTTIGLHRRPCSVPLNPWCIRCRQYSVPSHGSVLITTYRTRCIHRRRRRDHTPTPATSSVNVTMPTVICFCSFKAVSLKSMTGLSITTTAAERTTLTRTHLNGFDAGPCTKETQTKQQP